MKSLRAVAAVVALACLTTALTAEQSRGDSTKGCAKGIGKRQAVVLIHGRASSEATWKSMVAKLAADPTLYVRTFDYKDTATEWVDHPNNGPHFAKEVVCIAASSKEEGGSGLVDIGAHSMGGLITRYTGNLVVDGTKVHKRFGIVATLGTPNTGSLMGNFGSGLSRTACPWKNLITDKVFDASPCDIDVVKELSIGSRALRSLPKLDPSVPVLAVDGNVGFATSIRMPGRTMVVRVSTNTDIVVHKSSASWGNAHEELGGGKKTVACMNLDCWHSKLTSNPEVMDALYNAILKHRTATTAKILQFQNLRIPVPNGWKKGNLYMMPGISDAPNGHDIDIQTSTSCVKDVDGATRCPGFTVYDRIGSMVGVPATDYDPEYEFYQGTGVEHCVEHPNLWRTHLDRNKRIKRVHTTVGGRAAIYTEWSIHCSTMEGEQSVFETQRVWHIDGSEQVIIDHHRTKGLWEALKNARWTSE